MLGRAIRPMPIKAGWLALVRNTRVMQVLERPVTASPVNKFSAAELRAALVADFARRAGVGKGTVFRHFATKDDLITAIFLDRVNAMNAVGEQLLEAADPVAALLDFLTVAARQQQQRDLSLLQEAGELSPDVAGARALTSPAATSSC